MIKLKSGEWISPEAITRIAGSEKIPGSSMYHIMGSGTAFITTESADELAEKINEALRADAEITIDGESQVNMETIKQLLDLAEGGDVRVED